MENILIRKGEPKDVAAAFALVNELAEFEKAPDAITNTPDDMIRDGFGSKPAFEFYVAELNGSVVGIALYFIKYSTWKGRGLYLDDLIVTEKHRGKGIGKMLFEKILQEANLISANQVHWQVLDWNTPAIEFYKKYGASVESEWLDCKLDHKQFQEFRKPLSNQSR